MAQRRNSHNKLSVWLFSLQPKENTVFDLDLPVSFKPRASNSFLQIISNKHLTQNF